MCLAVSKNKRETIAKENYYVFKVVMKKDLMSLYYDFAYELNKTYFAELKPRMFKSLTIKEYNEGFHYYKTLKRAVKYLESWTPTYRQKMVVLVCVVPKGAHYINDDGDGVGVSNQLVTVTTLTYAQALKELKNPKICA